MSSRRSPEPIVRQGTVKHRRRLSVRRLSAYTGACLGALVLAIAVFVLVFGGAIVNGYGKRKVERAFAEAYPGYALRIGKMGCSVGANRLVAQSVTLSSTISTLKAGRISLTGVRWAQLLWSTNTLAQVLAQASLEATDLAAEFPQSQYGIGCARLRASVPGSELSAESTELRTLGGDEEFFSARGGRTTRFHLVVPECRVSGLAFGELLQGKAYRAGSIHLSRPSFEALVNCDKPVAPFVKSPLMAHEALASIRRPLQVDSLHVTNGIVRYCEQVAVGGEPGVLTFGQVSMTVEGIANGGEATAAVQLRAQGDLMDAGTLKVMMTIPVTSRDFSLHYSGSLSAMDLTRLDPFLDVSAHVRIKSGSVQEAAFDIDVLAGQARGWVRAIYQDLGIAVLDKQTGTEKGFDHRLASFFANVLKVRNSNGPSASGAMGQGNVSYTRSPEEEFLEFAWLALRSGVLDLISL